jgi:hypothetical protein
MDLIAALVTSEVSGTGKFAHKHPANVVENADWRAHGTLGD